MKPTTPEQLAKCYGTFIADLDIISRVLPAVNIWLQTNLPEISLVYKLNTSLFIVYKATIKSFPKLRTLPKGSDYPVGWNKYAVKYNSDVEEAWNAVAIDLKSALSCAGVDPSKIETIVASFNKLKPRPAPMPK